MAQFTNEDGSTYDGEVTAFEEPHGQGTETYPNGSKYVGEFKDGVKSGAGEYV